MPGQLYGNIDCFAGTSIAAKQASNRIFKNLFDFLNHLTSSGVTTRIAYNTGSFGTGTDYEDGANPFGRNAWACYRFNTSSVRTWDWYMLIQTTSGSGNFGDAPGDPGLVNASAESHSTNEGTIALACAAMITTGGMNLNPWNGTTNNDGDDSKGDPVWTTGSNTDILSVLPRSNNPGGSHDSSKENMAELFNGTTTGLNPRFHFLADEDALAIFISTADNDLYACQYIGYYEPRTELANANFTPLVMFVRDSDTADILNDSETFGTTTGNASAFEGGIAVSGAVRLGRIGRYGAGWQTDASLHPNTMTAPSSHDIFSVPVLSYESPDFGHVGYITSPIYQEVYNVNSHDTNSEVSRVVFGDSASTATTKIFTTWTGSVAGPGSSNARSGSTF